MPSLFGADLAEQARAPTRAAGPLRPARGGQARRRPAPPLIGARRRAAAGAAARDWPPGATGARRRPPGGRARAPRAPWRRGSARRARRRPWSADDEVGERAEHGAVAELVALAEQAGGGGGEAHALALQSLERVHLALERGDATARARARSARAAASRSRAARSACARRLQLGVGRRGGARGRVVERVGGGVEFALGGGERVGQRPRSALEHVRRAARSRRSSRWARSRSSSMRRARSCTSRSVPLGALGGGAGGGHGLARCRPRAAGARRARLERAQRASQLLPLGRGALRDPRRGGRGRLRRASASSLGALAAHLRVAVALLGHRHLAAQLLGALALFGHEARQLGALRLGGGACAVRRVARLFGRGTRASRRAARSARSARTRSSRRCELVVPRLHLARGERDLHRVAPRAELGVALGAPALARQRAHLGLHLGDQVVEALQVDGRLLEAALGGAAAVAVQAHAGRLLEQLAPVVGAVGEQGVDHLALDHDAGVGAEPGAAQQVVDVAQAAGRAVEQILALARPRQPAGDDHFPERRSAGRRPRSSKCSETSATFTARRADEPWKITSSILAPRSRRARCSPSTQRTASDTLDLPQPFGPTMAVTPGSKISVGGIGERLEAVQLELGQPH